MFSCVLCHSSRTFASGHQKATEGRIVGNGPHERRLEVHILLRFFRVSICSMGTRSAECTCAFLLPTRPVVAMTALALGMVPEQCHVLY